MSAELYRCTRQGCRYKYRVHRKPTAGRKIGHVKTMHCPLCNARRQFVRVW